MSTSWTRPRDGAGTWQHTREHETPGSVLVAFVACLLVCVAFVSLVVAGRAAMCRLHADDPQPLAYCSTAVK